MNWSDIGKKIAAAAPVLGGILGGPPGAVIGAAGSLLASFLGVEPEPRAVAAALTPETLVRLKELEVRQQEVLLSWQSEQLKCETANVTSARQREIELARAGHGASWGTSVVSVIVTLGFFVMLYFVMRYKAELGEAGLMLLGTLSTAFGAVINYYLGSSSGSAAKERIIQAQRAAQ